MLTSIQSPVTLHAPTYTYAAPWVRFGAETTPNTNVPRQQEGKRISGLARFFNLLADWYHRITWWLRGGHRSQTQQLITTLNDPKQTTKPTFAQQLQDEHYAACRTLQMPYLYFPSLKVTFYNDPSRNPNVRAGGHTPGNNQCEAVVNEAALDQPGHLTQGILSANHEAYHSKVQLDILLRLSEKERLQTVSNEVLTWIRRGHIPNIGFPALLNKQPNRNDLFRAFQTITQPILEQAPEWDARIQGALNKHVAADQKALQAVERRLLVALEPSKAPKGDDPTPPISPESTPLTHAAMQAIISSVFMVHNIASTPSWFDPADRVTPSDIEKQSAQRSVREKVALMVYTIGQHLEAQKRLASQPVDDGVMGLYEFHPEEVGARIFANQRLDTLYDANAEGQDHQGKTAIAGLKTTSRYHQTMWQAGADLWRQFQQWFTQAEAATSDLQALDHQSQQGQAAFLQRVTTERPKDTPDAAFHGLHQLAVGLTRILREQLQGIIERQKPTTATDVA